MIQKSLMKKLQGHGLKKNFSKEIAIIGLDYVGLPLAKSFAKYFCVKAFDKDEQRIRELQKGIDRNLDIKSKNLKNNNLSFTCGYDNIKNCLFFDLKNLFKKDKVDFQL